MINNKSKGSVAFLQLRRRNRCSRMVRIERFCQKQKILPVCVSHGICGMLTYDPLRVIYFVKGEKQRLVERIVLPFSRRKNRSASSCSINEMDFIANIQLTRCSSASIKQLEDALCLT